jgi:hypothetical protein
MPSGYCYEFGRDDSRWYISISEDWDTVVYTPTGTETKVGEKRIDGAPCVVFACPDGKFRAVNRVNVH